MTLSGVVVEDDDFTRVLMTRAFKSHGFSIQHEGSSPSAALVAIKEFKPDFLVADLHLGPGPTGIDLARGARDHAPKIGVIILTSYQDPRLLRSNLPALPVGSVYITKQEITSEQAIIDAVLRACSNNSEASIRTRVGNDSIQSLTDNQIELLRLMSLGLSNGEIAKRRFVTEKSVEVAINRLAKTLGVERNQNQNQRVHIAKTYFRALGMNYDD